MSPQKMSFISAATFILSQLILSICNWPCICFLTRFTFPRFSACIYSSLLLATFSQIHSATFIALNAFSILTLFSCFIIGSSLIVIILSFFYWMKMHLNEKHRLAAIVKLNDCCCWVFRMNCLIVFEELIWNWLMFLDSLVLPLFSGKSFSIQASPNPRIYLVNQSHFLLL